MENKVYICIDLKSFYASVECVKRGLDPLTTNLVVADKSRTEKTICLAVSPSLKSFGMKGRARLFEVVQKVKEINMTRKRNNNNNKFTASSTNIDELNKNKSLELDYIVAPPHMADYIKFSTEVYNTYLKYISSDDIYVYSIDEVFMDITSYLKYYGTTPRQLVTKMIHDVFHSTGITATAGIGTNLFLAKIAMDIVAKKMKPDSYGVRIAGLDEATYRKKLWTHQPLTDFWRVGKGYAKKLEEKGIFTMGDIALVSDKNEEILYKMFGVNAETLIDHAWGYEPCTMKSIKEYKSVNNSISTGQVLHCPYNYEKTKIIIYEMADSLASDLVSKNILTNKLVLTVGYDIDNLTDENISHKYKGEIVEDFYGRKTPKHAHGTISLENYTSSSTIIMDSTIKLFERIINKDLLVRRVNIAAINIVDEAKYKDAPRYEQLNLFTTSESKIDNEDTILERNLQKTIIELKKKYGKNTILKGMNLLEGATMKERNKQIGGHQE